jgi:hypothetical protein
MHAELDQAQMTKEAFFVPAAWSAHDIEVAVVQTRLTLYNEGLPCGPKAIRRHITEYEHIQPVPSERTIARMLTRNGLTHGRTGWYEGDRPEWVPPTAHNSHPFCSVSGPCQDIRRLEIATQKRSSRVVF